MASKMLRFAGAAALLFALPASVQAEVKVFVYGQSGKFKMYDTAQGNQGSAPGPTVTMDELVERDSSGVAVCNTGPASAKHSINSFATQSFTVHDVEPNITIGEAKANRVKFSTEIGDAIGNLQVDTYVISQAGAAGNGEEEWNFTVGDMKWNVVFNNWTWCTGGSFLDLKVTVSGLEGAKKAANASKVTFGNTSLVLARKVELDGNLTQMPEGYPSVEIQGGAVGITFRFPKFEHNATYDPGFVNGDSAEGDAAVGGAGLGGATTTAAPGNNTAASNNTALVSAAAVPRISAWLVASSVIAVWLARA